MKKYKLRKKNLIWSLTVVLYGSGHGVVVRSCIVYDTKLLVNKTDVWLVEENVHEQLRCYRHN